MTTARTTGHSKALLTFLLGAVAPISRLWQGGWHPRATAEFAAVLVVWTVVLRLTTRRPLVRLAALLVVPAAGVALTVGSIGRAPVLVGLAGVLVADAALHGTAWLAPRWGRPTTSTLVALIPLVAAEVTWWAETPNSATGALLGVASVAILVHRVRPATLDGTEARAREVGSTVAAAGGRASTAAARAARHGGRAAGAIGRSVLAATGALRTALRAGRRSTVRTASAARGSVTAVVATVERAFGRRPNLDVPLVAIGSALAMAPLLWKLASNPSYNAPHLVGYDDFPTHISVARELPYSLFHFGVWFLAPVIGNSAAATIVVTAFASLLGVGLVRLARRSSASSTDLGRLGAVLFAVFVLVAESPTALLVATGVVGTEHPYVRAHIWGSPTETVSIACSLVLLVALLDAIDASAGDGPQRSGWPLFWLAFLAVAAKPTFAMALLPGLPAYLLLSGRWRRRSARALAVRVIVPMVLVMVVQGWLFIVIAPDKYRSGIRLAPLEVARELRLGEGGLAWYTLLVLFAICVWAGGRRYFTDTGIALTWVCLAFAIVPLLLLRETGAFANHGNVAKPAQMCFSVLYVLSVRFVAVEVRSAWRRRAEPGFRWPAWSIALAVFAVAALCGGVVTYLNGVGLLTVA